MLQNKPSEEQDLSVLDLGSVAPELPASQAPDSDGPVRLTLFCSVEVSLLRFLNIHPGRE